MKIKKTDKDSLEQTGVKSQDTELQYEKNAEVQEDPNYFTDAQIMSWKTQFGRIFKTTIGDNIFVWRKVKRGEYVKIMSDSDEFISANLMYKRQEDIAKICTLFPKNIVDVIASDAGIATTLAEEILAKSGFIIPQTKEL